jgi:DASS family divalent anion:Na+ symporter
MPSDRTRTLLATVGIGVLLWILPPPLSITSQAWHLFAIFVATMTGIILQPLPSGAVALAALGTCVLTNTLPFQTAFSAFGPPQSSVTSSSSVC